jgi:hypothetical protein
MTNFTAVDINGAYQITVTGHVGYDQAVFEAREHELAEIAWHQEKIDRLDAGQVRVFLLHDGGKRTEVLPDAQPEEAEGQR